MNGSIIIQKAKVGDIHRLPNSSMTLITSPRSMTTGAGITNEWAAVRWGMREKDSCNADPHFLFCRYIVHICHFS